MNSLYDILKAGFEVRLRHEPDNRMAFILVSKQDHHCQKAIADAAIDHARSTPDVMVFIQALCAAKEINYDLKKEKEALNENPD